MELRFYGGVNQIGGNKILVKDRSRGVGVFLDFGMNFTETGKYFEEFIQPRPSNGIADFLEMGIIPKVDGIYRRDLLRFAGIKSHSEPAVDAVMLSHAHLDHTSHVSFLDERIPIYCNGTTFAIMKAIQETGRRSIGSEIVDFKKRPILNYQEKPIERKFVKVGKKFVVDGLEIDFIPVDHSVPGASAMIIYGSDTTIAYSGDLRMHGTDGHLTREFVDRLASEKPDLFLCEGTRIDQTDRNSESYVRDNSTRAIADTKGLVVADFAFKDTTRFKTFFEVAKATGRKLAIEFKDAYYIRELSKQVEGLPALGDENLLLYQGKKGSGTYREEDYEKWENEFLDRANTVRAEYIAKHQKETIVALGFYDVPELIDIRPKPGSLYIKSASEAFNEEQVFDMVRLRAWLDHFGMRYEQIHASGHAPREDLAYVIKGSGAKTIMPIHTEHADQFASLSDARIQMPELAAH